MNDMCMARLCVVDCVQEAELRPYVMYTALWVR
jgi:hypothetical protein